MRPDVLLGLTKPQEGRKRQRQQIIDLLKDTQGNHTWEAWKHVPAVSPHSGTVSVSWPLLDYSWEKNKWFNQLG